MANLKSLPANKQTLQLQVKGSLLNAFESINHSTPTLLLAYSGGLDSTVLLHLLAQLRGQIPFQLKAMHVHHGLSPNATYWAEHCQKVCEQYQVPFLLSHVVVDMQSGLGVEASARNARYQALFKETSDLICLAHHQDDQAETLLLQLTRGAGVKGLSGMAAVDFQKKLFRPLLDVDRATLEKFAHQHHFKWIEDESNLDTTFDRNFIRHDVLPILQAEYPAIKKTLSRTARHMAEATQLLEELASIDAQYAIVKSKDSIFDKLDINQLEKLSEARAKNLVRWWLSLHQSKLVQLLMPSTDVLAQALHQLLNAKSDALVKVKLGQDLFIRKYSNYAYLVVESKEIPPYNILWQGEHEIYISEDLRVTFQQCLGEGLSLKKLEHVKLRIKSRDGGERFKPELGRPSRTIKRMMQEYNVPPWRRASWPLVFIDETLVAIPNLGVDVNLKASPTELGLVIQCVMA